MDWITIYLSLVLFVAAMNAAPFFMPPTWIVLVFFTSNYNLPLVPTVIAGALAATTGRVVLALLAKTGLRRFIPKRLLTNYDDLGRYFRENDKLSIPVLFAYAFPPIPSNQVFIIAGLTSLPLLTVAGAFFVGRLISYTFWVSTASHITNGLGSIFTQELSQVGAIVIQLIGFAAIIWIGRVNWRKVLNIKREDEPVAS